MFSVDSTSACTDTKSKGFERGVAYPISGLAHDVLVIPQLASEIPSEVSLMLNQKLAKFGLELLNAGFISEGATDELDVAVQGGLSQWIKEFAGEVKPCLDVEAIFSDDTEVLEMLNADEQDDISGCDWV